MLSCRFKKIKSPLKEAQIDMIGENNPTQSGEVLLCDCVRTGKGAPPTAKCYSNVKRIYTPMAGDRGST